MIIMLPEDIKRLLLELQEKGVLEIKVNEDFLLEALAQLLPPSQKTTGVEVFDNKVDLYDGDIHNRYSCPLIRFGHHAVLPFLLAHLSPEDRKNYKVRQIRQDDAGNWRVEFRHKDTPQAQWVT